MSPFKPSSSLSDDELATLYTAIRTVLGDAVKRSSGLPASELKGEKKTHLAVHGRKGATCPVCGDVVREVSFADTFLNYCATCQTGGKPLADRRTSKFLK
jgi:formamidopyrimidine-DNA glycosylase